MTREEATAQAEALQKAHPEAKWLATRRGDEWAVARIDLAPGTDTTVGTTAVPDPPPRADPYSQQEWVASNYGFLG